MKTDRHTVCSAVWKLIRFLMTLDSFLAHYKTYSSGKLCLKWNFLISCFWLNWFHEICCRFERFTNIRTISHFRQTASIDVKSAVICLLHDINKVTDSAKWEISQIRLSIYQVWVSSFKWHRACGIEQKLLISFSETLSLHWRKLSLGGSAITYNCLKWYQGSENKWVWSLPPIRL